MSEGTNYKPVIKKLSKKQREVLDQICINNDRGHSSIILKSLIRKELVQMYVQKLDVMCGIYRYTFATYGVHMAWCEVCAEENPEEDI